MKEGTNQHTTMNFIQRYQPSLSWIEEIDQFFDRNQARNERLAARHSSPRESIHESDDAWILRLDLPGFSKADVTLTVTGRELHLKAETPEDKPFGGKSERQWKLGDDVDDSAITANLENGVLELKLPKRPKSEARSIDIA